MAASEQGSEWKQGKLTFILLQMSLKLHLVFCRNFLWLLRVKFTKNEILLLHSNADDDAEANAHSDVEGSK